MVGDFTIEYHVYDIRTRKDLSERAISELSGVSKSQINNIENGLKHPTVYTLCLLSLALGVSPSELFTMKVRDCPP